MDPRGVLSPPFPIGTEYKGELLPGIEWIMSLNKGIQWAQGQLLPLAAPEKSSESGKRNRHKAQAQQKYHRGSAVVLLSCAGKLKVIASVHFARNAFSFYSLSSRWHSAVSKNHGCLWHFWSVSRLFLDSMLCTFHVLRSHFHRFYHSFKIFLVTKNE